MSPPEISIHSSCPDLFLGIHVFTYRGDEDVDGRDKHCHDGGEMRSMTASQSIQHPLGVGAVEGEGRHIYLETLAALAHHLIAAGHEARRRRERHAGGIFEAIAWREHGL